MPHTNFVVRGCMLECWIISVGHRSICRLAKMVIIMFVVPLLRYISSLYSIHMIYLHIFSMFTIIITIATVE